MAGLSPLFLCLGEVSVVASAQGPRGWIKSEVSRRLCIQFCLLTGGRSAASGLPCAADPAFVPGGPEGWEAPDISWVHSRCPRKLQLGSFGTI